ncbi:MAG: AAA family ATPase [Nanoarchaeota archaeon]
MKNEFKKTVLELNELLNQDSLKARELGQKRDSLMIKREELSKMELKHANVKESIHANIAVKKILENKNTLGEVYGTVSELGSVSSKYSLALEIAAGHKIHSVVVEDDKTAAKCIKYLKENKFGVSTFLPLNKIKTFPSTHEAIKHAEEKGVHGFATNLVNYDNKFKNVFSYVFGNTLVVDNIDVSRKLGIGSVRTVTLDGDLTEPSGAMIGGYRHKNFGSFKEHEMEDKINKNRNEVDSLEREIKSVEEWRKESDEKITRLREIKAGLEGDIIKTEKSLHLDSGDLIASQQYKEELEEQLKKNNSSLAELDSKLNDLTEKVVQLKIKRQELRNKATELRKPTILAQLNAFDEKRKELSESVIKMDAELRNIEMQSNEVGYKERENVLGSINGLDKEKKNFESEMDVLSGEIKEKEKELGQKEEDQKEFYAEYKSLFDKRNKSQDFINSCESKVLVQEEKSRNEELQINTVSIEEARMKAEIAGIEVEISQYPGVELDLEKSEEEFKKSIASQERSLAGIGNVNMRALEIYEITEKEYTGLVVKKESLKVEKEEVLNLMNEIEGSKKDLFMNSLNVINENFKRIFLDLSSKGDAFLEVENPEKLFEEGIRIKVKLAGEKFLDIRSLSGGEKTMTALAFLFAIQEHEPASFYVLDEVDAALDKHNSQLLANLIRKYCHKAQYIVISHNDAVISEADILYGVSMKKDVGISQVVSLAMEEAREKIQAIKEEVVAVSN